MPLKSPVPTRRSIALLICALALSLLATGLGTAPAYAESCVGAECINMDPKTSGCEKGARTLGKVKTLRNSKGQKVGKVELRYSDKCKAAWARTQSYVGKRSLRAEIQNCAGKSLTALATANGRVHWSPMEYLGPRSGYVRAFGSVNFSNNNGRWKGSSQCFGRNFEWHGCPDDHVCVWKDIKYKGDVKAYAWRDLATVDLPRGFKNEISSWCNRTAYPITFKDRHITRRDDYLSDQTYCVSDAKGWSDRIDEFSWGDIPVRDL